jgi:hypothetical protein
MINPDPAQFKTKDIVREEPLRARLHPLFFTPHFQLYPTGSASGLFPPSAPASERCIDRSESRHLLSACSAIFPHQ